MDILNCINKTTLQGGYSQEVADSLVGMMKYMIDKQLVGACHATASAFVCCTIRTRFASAIVYRRSPN